MLEEDDDDDELEAEETGLLGEYDSDDDDLRSGDPQVDEFRASIAGYNPIITHAVEDDAEAVEAQLRLAPNWRACMTTTECHGMPPIHFAALCGSASAARVLLEAGTPASLVDANGHTPLVLAVRAASMRSINEAADPLDEEGEAAELEGFLTTCADLLACGAKSTELLGSTGAQDLLEWLREDEPGRTEWRWLLRGALTGQDGDDDDDDDDDDDAWEAEQLAALGVPGLEQLPARPAAALCANALTHTRPQLAVRWELLRGRGVRSAWRTLGARGLEAATAEERAELLGDRAAPEESRARFWDALGTLGRERAAAVLEAHPHETAQLLRAATRTVPPLLTAARLQAEVQLALLRHATLDAAGDAQGEQEGAGLQALRALVAPPARCRVINVLDATGGFALHAAAAAASTEAVQTLLHGRANPNICGARGTGTALQAAVGRGSLPVIDALLRAGADPNRDAAPSAAAPAGDPTSSGTAPPLVMAVGGGNVAVARLLLEAGAHTAALREARPMGAARCGIAMSDEMPCEMRTLLREWREQERAEEGRDEEAEEEEAEEEEAEEEREVEAEALRGAGEAPPPTAAWPETSPASATPVTAPAAAAAAAPAVAPAAPPPAPADLWAPGTVVTVCGLRGAMQHNGKLGKVLRYNSGAGRYETELETGEQLKIRPANLEKAAAGDDGVGVAAKKEDEGSGGGDGDGLAGPSATAPAEPPKEGWDKGIEDKWWNSLFAPPGPMAQAPDTWDKSKPPPPPPPPPPGAPPDWAGMRAPWETPDPLTQFDELFESCLTVDGETVDA